ncbi:FumA C-terminus/TtdB family hydratase beta subunit [Alphaproteobacteria bacterium]|nr:FumA C-terminus/TtdB family hydratase beta subunit [Alphaproteobacteria bacterium]
MFPLTEDKTEYMKISDSFVKTSKINNTEILIIDPKALTFLSQRAFKDVSHLLRKSHLQQLRNILDDKEASNNDHFVALTMLKNANISSSGVLPMCQDTGTAIILGYKGEKVFTNSDDGKYLSLGVYNTYQENNLRFSQLAPFSMFEEKNTANNLPAEISLFASEGQEYKFAFVQKGGGSANKSFLFQATPATLNSENLKKFLYQKIISLGTAACPPYHLSIVIGGTSAELNLKTVKLGSMRYLDNLPNHGDYKSGHAFRDHEWEKIILDLTREIGIGAQFGGKYFCHDVRVIRLPRHGASLPIGVGVSCSADRQILGKINKNGVFLEKLETDPSQFMPDINQDDITEDLTNIDLRQPMKNILKQLNECEIKKRVSLTGPLIVARDIAHAKLLERLNIDGALPDYIKDHPVYYAGPAKTPKGMASGSFGPTTAGRMDAYVDKFQQNGGSLVMLAKGNRSSQVRDACHKYGGFYLGTIGGTAAKVALDCIKKIEVLEYPELGMEAIWKIEVENFPAFVVIDNKGNDFFQT